MYHCLVHKRILSHVALHVSPLSISFDLTSNQDQRLQLTKYNRNVEKGSICLLLTDKARLVNELLFIDNSHVCSLFVCLFACFFVLSFVL